MRRRHDGTSCPPSPIPRARHRSWRATSIAAAALALATVPAQAQLKFCNHSPETVSIAIAYHSGGDWVSEGWWSPGPSECVTVIRGWLPNKRYYAFAHSASHVWSQNYVFCVKSEKFTIYGDGDCAARGYRAESFFEIEVGDRVSWTQNLTSPSEPSSLASRIIGTWRGSNHRLQFMRDGTLVMYDDEMQFSGTYQLTGGTGIKIQFTGILALGGVMVGEVSVTGDRLDFSAPGWGSETYTRVR